MIRSLNGLGYEILELLRANNRVTDSFDIRFAKTWVQQTRATLLKQKLDDPYYIIDEHNIQDLGKVAMAPVDSSIGSVESDKFILRSVSKIPPTINRKGNIGTFTRIASVDLLEAKFNFVSYERALYSGNGKFNQNDIYAFTHEGYMYLMSKSNLHKLIKEIHIKGVFVNPEDAYNFRYPNTWTDDMEYPVSEAIVMDMQNMILDKKFKFIMTPYDDNRADGADNIVNPVTKK
jgi:hypothetical protein